MADNPPAPNPGSLPPLPASGLTGRLKSPTTHLPVKKGGAGKIVVMLSSVAKPPPANTQALPKVSAPSEASPKPPETSQIVNRPPPLPPKQVTPDKKTPSRPQLSTTTYVKLPPKTTVPGWSSLSGQPVPVPAEKAVPASIPPPPPPLPIKVAEPVRTEAKKSSAQHIPPIKLNQVPGQNNFSGESIFLQRQQPAPTPKPEPIKVPEPPAPQALKASPQSLEAFESSQSETAKPIPPIPVPEAKDKPAPLVAPPLLPPQPASLVRPPPLPLSSAMTATTLPLPIAPLHIAPPMLEQPPELPSEKLPPPHLPVDTRTSEKFPDLPESSAVHKVPAMIQQDLPTSKPLLPPTPVTKTSGWMKKTTPLVLSSTSKLQPPKIAEAKPALKPAVLPSRSLPPPLVSEEVTSTPPVAPPPIVAPKPIDKVEAITAASAAVESAAVIPPPDLPEVVTPAPENVATSAAPSVPVPPLPTSSVPAREKAPLPLTRAARAKKRRLWSTVVFWAFILPVTLLLLYFGSLHFGRDTRVEGEVIPPPGMTLSNEVWIVSDFRELASGISEDLAAERAPLLQEIQEKQDHVQRAQADVAAREERIRLIQDEIDASKTEIDSIIKQSRDATQKVWDVDGAQIDAEYTDRFNQLQKTIADRAKSLKLTYQPDPNFESPEVWANAYRLALYQVPAGVDTVKEHQWLGDQMTQWRAYLKTLDDRKEQLREKAAQIKLAPASRITDLNSKIVDLGIRIDATETEEVPLKAELQQAQADLVQVQAAESTLDDKYYKQLYVLPEESIVNHLRFHVASNGRFTWVDDDVFAEGDPEHHYWIFALATRPDGRQYWVLGHFSIQKDHKVCLLIEPDSFVSTKAMLRPDLSPDEQAQ
jgi:hypothetical protein